MLVICIPSTNGSDPTVRKAMNMQIKIFEARGSASLFIIELEEKVNYFLKSARSPSINSVIQNGSLCIIVCYEEQTDYRGNTIK